MTYLFDFVKNWSNNLYPWSIYVRVFDFLHSLHLKIKGPIYIQVHLFTAKKGYGSVYGKKKKRAIDCLQTGEKFLLKWYLHISLQDFSNGENCGTKVNQKIQNRLFNTGTLLKKLNIESLFKDKGFKKEKESILCEEIWMIYFIKQKQNTKS